MEKKRMEGKREVEMSSSNSTSCMLSFGENSNGLMTMMMPHMPSHHHHDDHHHHHHHHHHQYSNCTDNQPYPSALFLPPPPQEYRFNYQNNNNITSGSSMEIQNDAVVENTVYSSSSSSSSSVKAKIMAHPHYHRLLTAFVNCQKVGAPPEVVARLEEVCAAAGAGAVGHAAGSLGEDPALDQFMEAYCEMLIKYEQEISKPFKEAIFFLQRMESQLNSLSLSSSSLSACSSEAGTEQRNNNNNMSPEESLAEMVDAQAEDGELKGQLLRKYSGYLGSLKQEFMKKRKKGKLPKEAREQLLDWWSRHYKWPYPSEQQKLALAESTGLDHKQINNWFINQRKRHWKPSEEMQFVVMDASSSHPHFYFDNVLDSPYPMDTML